MLLRLKMKSLKKLSNKKKRDYKKKKMNWSYKINKNNYKKWKTS